MAKFDEELLARALHASYETLELALNSRPRHMDDIEYAKAKRFSRDSFDHSVNNFVDSYLRSLKRSGEFNKKLPGLLEYLQQNDY